MRRRPGTFSLLRTAGKGFIDDDCATMAAALSYYTVFSLPPLVALVLLIVGAIWTPDDANALIQSQIGVLLGPTGIDLVRVMLEQAQGPRSGLLPSVVGSAALLFGATGAFMQIQAALNRAWAVAPDPTRSGGFRRFFLKRVLSFGMILGLAFLLLVSLVVSTALATIGAMLGGFLPGGTSALVAQAANVVGSTAVITLLFASIYRLMPDARIAWRDVWVGALVTAVLFTLGKTLLAVYLGHADPGQAFGAAGSLAVLFLWIYYASIILLFGAEFTEAWAERDGGITPEPGAVRIVREIVAEPPAGDAHS